MSEEKFPRGDEPKGLPNPEPENVKVVEDIKANVIKLLEEIKKSPKLNDYKHPPRKIFDTYSEEEKIKIKNFKGLAGRLRNLYGFFRDNEIDILLDEILVYLKFDYYENMRNIGDITSGVRRWSGLVPRLPGNFAENATGLLSLIPETLERVTGKVGDVVRDVVKRTVNYKIFVNDLEKYVISNEIIDKNYKGGTNRRSRKYRRSQSRRLPNRKIGRRSRKH